MKKLFTILTVLFLVPVTFILAQEEQETPSKFSLSGSVDAYFRSNLNAPNKGDAAQAPETSFANLPGFALGMANVIATYEGEKVGFVADLVFGPRGEDAVFGSPMYTGGMAGSSQIVNQLYMYYNVSDVVTLTMGNFNTYLGYEVISPTGNFNYSTSYMFSYGPFSHTGLKADFQLSDNWSFMAAIMNPTDMTEFNFNGSYTLGGQLAYTTDAGGTYLNLLYGDQDGKLDMNTMSAFGPSSMGNTFQIDLTAGYDVTESMYIGLNTTYNTTAAGQMYNGSSIQDATGDGYGFYGVAGYLQFATSDKFSIGARGEYFKVFNDGLDGVVGLNGVGDGRVVAGTLSGNIKISDNFTIIPETRLDMMSDNFFINNDYQSSKNLASFLVAGVFSF
ncbi:porin [Cyclobacterium marinum]|uniref:porin n=1 Tax=Cyclobacterium marinum TaxID=104 RepID=UPI0011ED10A6|nr:porin [Cyclobacterium marinum]MBI0399742.1 porin [Cyclobacterium marinum]